MRHLLIALFLLLLGAGPAAASDWADATPTAWHQLARAESLLSAPEPPNPVAVCIVDSGVNLTPDLAPVVVERLAYDGGDPGDTYPQDGIDDGHGTYVATFLAGQVNGWGSAGLWPRAKIVSVRVFPPGRRRTATRQYIEGLRLCRQRPDVKVINLSLGDIDGSEHDLAALADRIHEYRRAGINIVAAAGNRAGPVEVPARFAEAIAVGAADAQGQLCAFSARGEGLDLLAPGCDLSAADQHGGPVTFQGTSFAAPMVAATLLALRSHAGLNADEAEQRLLETARQAPDGRVLDVHGSLSPMADAWSDGRSRPIQTPAPSSVERPPFSDFIDYAQPRVRITRVRGARVHVRILNKPRGAAVEVRAGGRGYESRHSALVLTARRRSSRFRFISDIGISPWRRVRLRPFAR